MTIEQAMELWPFTDHPEALPYWHYENVIRDPQCCTCATRDHRKKGCLIGPQGRKCSTCGALHQDYGNSFHHCQPCQDCQDWLDRREKYLADWAAEALANASMTTQLALL